MAFGGKVDHGVWLVGFKQMLYKLGVADVAVHENMPRIIGQRGEILGITGVGEFVQIDNRIPGPTTGKDVTGADEAGTAGNKEGCHKIPRDYQNATTSIMTDALFMPNRANCCPRKGTIKIGALPAFPTFI